MSKIEWDLTTTQHTLKNLMEKRFQILLREGGEQILWEDVFDETHEMTGRQRKYNYILDRTFNRPRDIIKFSNLLLDKMRLRKISDPKSPDKFINDDITQAKEEYSRYFISEMDDEIHKHLPDYEIYLNALRNISTWYFTLEEFRNSLAELDVKEDHLEVIKKLFRFSIVGFLRAGGKSGGSQYIFRYKSSLSPFDARASRFRVHPGLIESLDLKRNNSRPDGDTEEESDN